MRALKPWPGTYTFWNRPGHEPLRLLIDNVSVAEGRDIAQSAPGQVIVSDGSQLIVATGQTCLVIHAIAPAGKRHMTVEEFLRGYRLRSGDLLGSHQPAA